MPKIHPDFPDRSAGITAGRIIVPVLGAAIVTVLCFLLMQSLIATTPLVVEPEPLRITTPVLEFAKEDQPRPQTDRKKNLLPSELPEEDEGLLERPRFTVIEGEAPELASPTEQHMDVSSGFSFQPPITGLTPLRVVQPIYPFKAVIKEIEGEVVVEFTVTEAGFVVNPVVVSSKPDDIFDDAALEAISKFTFRPPQMDGQSFQADGVRLKFSFKLDEDGEGMIDYQP